MLPLGYAGYVMVQQRIERKVALTKKNKLPQLFRKLGLITRLSIKSSLALEQFPNRRLSGYRLSQACFSGFILGYAQEVRAGTWVPGPKSGYWAAHPIAHSRGSGKRG